MKKIIFFDGDGTLWYPKSTKHEKKPHWIYYDSDTAKEPNAHLMLTPTALHTLEELRKRGMILVILSTHPHPPLEADAIIQGKVKHFKLTSLFDEVHATKEHHDSKGEFMCEILKRRGIPKEQALMVGDMYEWDYKPAQDNRIDALLIESAYQQEHLGTTRTIKELKEIIKYI